MISLSIHHRHADRCLQLPLTRSMHYARSSGIEEQHTEAIARHSSGRHNRNYGEFLSAVLHREI